MDRGTAIVLGLLVAPVPLVLVVAFARGYSITVVFHRRNRGDRE